MRRWARFGTRFPPEASGFMHIGHAKAALCNYMLAQKYNGRMIFRFDDTNPVKEKHEFEQAILSDLKQLEIPIEKVTYTSDRFEEMLMLCERMIKAGDAYCDDTDVDTMRDQRMKGEKSACRDNSVEKNLEMWERMKEGAAVGTIVRAKMSYDDANKCLRDPAMYRVVPDPPHVRTGTKYKVYPTYDFACPIVDSLDGVTHALRTSEYNDRNPQYSWFCAKLGLREPRVEDFSRLNMMFTVMSKRGLTKFVEKGIVSGWDDPRFPTVRGLLRRGLTVEALKRFITDQGMSRANNFQEWGVLWNTNSRVIDPEQGSQCKRYTAVARDFCTRVKLVGHEGGLKTGNKLWHKKNPDLGEKTIYYNDAILVEEEDMVLLKNGQEVTLMDWGNCVLEFDTKDGRVPEAKGTLNLKGDFSKTYKMTWLADCEQNRVLLEIQDYGYLINTQKMPSVDELDAVVNPESKGVTWAWGEDAMKQVVVGEILQLERRGYYRVDAVEPHIVLVNIPDGKEKVNHLSYFGRLKRLQGGTKKKADVRDEKNLTYDEKKAAKKAQKGGSTAAPKGELDATALDIRVGKIISVDRHHDADRLYVEKIDLGEASGPRTIVSGLVKYYKKEEMDGRMVAVLCNLKPAAMRGVESCGMVLCASTANKEEVELLGVPEGAKVGERIGFEGFDMPAEIPEIPKKKKDKLLEPLNTDDQGRARWGEHLFKSSTGPLVSRLKKSQVS
eukprot:Sspe_Gene.1882::Locus_625_Transcript_1_1_Confidence_1.000_Length_2841::g.1882::m.1882/K01885/EARS, gltX; glutamyl-tRNA synthetase